MVTELAVNATVLIKQPLIDFWYTFDTVAYNNIISRFMHYSLDIYVNNILLKLFKKAIAFVQQLIVGDKTTPVTRNR